jgi:fucose permease
MLFQGGAPVNRSSTVGVLGLGTAAGLLLSLYGPAIPELASRYGIGEGTSALVLSAHFLGAMTGIAWWGLERRLASRTWLATGTGLVSAGAAAIVVAPAWPVVLGGAVGLGIGFGVIVVEINVLLSEGFGERAAAMLNLLGATFGAGAVAGPLILAASGGYRLPFCGGALLTVGALALARDLPRTTPPPPDVVRPRTSPALVAGFVAVVALYVGTESGIGGFEATSLLAGGAGAAAAASWTAGYWAALTTGRLLAIPLALRVTPAVLTAGSLLAAAGGLGLAHVPRFAAVAYTLTGLLLGPVFPTVLAWLALVAPGSRTSTAMVFAAGQVGGIILPVVIGRLVDAGSPAVIPSTVLGVALCCLGAVLLLRRPAGRALERAATAPVSPGDGPGPSPGRR